jgi:prepilin-type processing-associated H-X9-DG protein
MLTLTDDATGVTVTGLSIKYWSYAQVSFAGTTACTFSQAYLGPYIKTVKVIQCPSFDQYNVAVVNVPNCYAISSVSVGNIGQLSHGSETVIFADGVNYSTSAGLSRPSNIFPPSSGNDVFQARHQKGNGNVGFYDGHVEAFAVQVRPAYTYSNAPSAAYLAAAQSLRIGPLANQRIDFSQTPSATAYTAACQNIYDYLFWRSKSAKQ